MRRARRLGAGVDEEDELLWADVHEEYNAPVGPGDEKDKAPGGQC